MWGTAFPPLGMKPPPAESSSIRVRVQAAAAACCLLQLAAVRGKGSCMASLWVFVTDAAFRRCSVVRAESMDAADEFEAGNRTCKLVFINGAVLMEPRGLPLAPCTDTLRPPKAYTCAPERPCIRS